MNRSMFKLDRLTSVHNFGDDDVLQTGVFIGPNSQSQIGDVSEMTHILAMISDQLEKDRAEGKASFNSIQDVLARLTNQVDELQKNAVQLESSVQKIQKFARETKHEVDMIFLQVTQSNDDVEEQERTVIRLF